MSWKPLWVLLLLFLVHISLFGTPLTYSLPYPNFFLLSHPLKTCPPLLTSIPTAPAPGCATCEMAVDQGHLVAVLCDRGVMEANRSNPHILVNALKQFKDFRLGYLFQQLSGQLTAITFTRLLEKAIPQKETRMAQGQSHNTTLAGLLTVSSPPWCHCPGHRLSHLHLLMLSEHWQV